VYEGELVVRRGPSGLEFVNEVDLETYVAGVIANEVGPHGVPATFRAQAVTARTYAWRRLTDREAASKTFHLHDDARSQVYKGRTVPATYGYGWREMLAAAQETRGVVLGWQGRPFPAYYASTCGGHTTDAGTSRLDPGHAGDLLQGVPCAHCRTSKYYGWIEEVDERDLVEGLRRDGRPVVPPIHEVRVTKRGRGGWAAEVTVVYGPERKERTVPGPSFRTAARLRSHNLEAIERTREGFRVRGRGWGHGVGMCQWGAIEMGRKGATETEILRYYYPGVSFLKLY
jgi:stage II sporulation protein D